MSDRPRRKNGQLAKKRGRKPKWEDRFPRLAYRLALLNATDVQVAATFGVTVTALNNWKKAHPELLAALRKGRDEADANVARALYRRAVGYRHRAKKIFCQEGLVTEVPYTEQYPPDTGAAVFWLKNRAQDKWRDKQEVEHSGEIGLADRLSKAVKRADGN
jgi:hypothetical protein